MSPHLHRTPPLLLRRIRVGQFYRRLFALTRKQVYTFQAPELVPMQDMLTYLQKLRADAAECALIRDLATDPAKKDLFARLAEHLNVLAAEVERAIELQSE
jgi:hypothetical protein